MARFVWHTLPEARKKGPRWLLDLRHASGVYLFRWMQTKEVLYVGSSQGNLKKTLLRHLQVWVDDRPWWKKMGAFIGTEDPRHWTAEGTRHAFQVAVRVLPRAEARKLEARIIQRLKPKGNMGTAEFSLF